jgi:hypothetical protein
VSLSKTCKKTKFAIVAQNQTTIRSRQRRSLQLVILYMIHNETMNKLKTTNTYIKHYRTLRNRIHFKNLHNDI